MFVMTCAVCLQVLSHDLIITRRAIYCTTPVPLFFHCPILLLEHNTQPCLIHLGSTQSVSVSSFPSFVISHHDIYISEQYVHECLKNKNGLFISCCPS